MVIQVHQKELGKKKSDYLSDLNFIITIWNYHIGNDCNIHEGKIDKDQAQRYLLNLVYAYVRGATGDKLGSGYNDGTMNWAFVLIDITMQMKEWAGSWRISFIEAHGLVEAWREIMSSDIGMPMDCVHSKAIDDARQIIRLKGRV